MKKLSFITILSLFVIATCGIKAEATSASVYFGSASYGNTVGEAINIAVYIESSDVLDEYEIIVSYDTSYLSYVSGGISGGNGKIVVSGLAYANQVRTMLTFTALQTGSTTVRVSSAEAISYDDGNDLTISSLPSAPVTITAVVEEVEEVVEEATPEVEAEPEVEEEAIEEVEVEEVIEEIEEAEEEEAAEEEEPEEEEEEIIEPEIEEEIEESDDSLEYEVASATGMFGLPTGIDIILILVGIELIVIVGGLLSRKILRLR